MVRGLRWVKVPPPGWVGAWLPMPPLTATVGVEAAAAAAEVGGGRLLISTRFWKMVWGLVRDCGGGWGGYRLGLGGCGDRWRGWGEALVFEEVGIGLGLAGNRLLLDGVWLGWVWFRGLLGRGCDVIPGWGLGTGVGTCGGAGADDGAGAGAGGVGSGSGGWGAPLRVVTLGVVDAGGEVKPWVGRGGSSSSSPSLPASSPPSSSLNT
ncbi:hypothetical protein E2C01_035866 [Portunus trituberculatus]|uniref:Uncharacterized protein n=1 Tax=Portunus trituberculatus TaxID=210409 RepID=A0A5B7FAG3_PORTR|nr:hypothetical protein [Portunus trituberculatus]